MLKYGARVYIDVLLADGKPRTEEDVTRELAHLPLQPRTFVQSLRAAVRNGRLYRKTDGTYVTPDYMGRIPTEPRQWWQV